MKKRVLILESGDVFFARDEHDGKLSGLRPVRDESAGVVRLVFTSNVDPAKATTPTPKEGMAAFAKAIFGLEPELPVVDPEPEGDA